MLHHAPSVLDLRDLSLLLTSCQEHRGCPVGVSRESPRAFPEVGRTGSFYLRVSPDLARYRLAPSVPLARALSIMRGSLPCLPVNCETHCRARGGKSQGEAKRCYRLQDMPLGDLLSFQPDYWPVRVLRSQSPISQYLKSWPRLAWMAAATP